MRKFEIRIDIDAASRDEAMALLDKLVTDVKERDSFGTGGGGGGAPGYFFKACIQQPTLEERVAALENQKSGGA